jgi:predicted membrane protein
MTNLILFINAFLSYLLCFVFIIALVIVACVIGVKWRKSKDAKAALQSEEVEADSAGKASA